jgi:hypothetical protein
MARIDLGELFQGVLFRGAIAVSTSICLSEFTVVNLCDAPDWDDLCARLTLALQLISSLDPAGYGRLTRSFNTILVMPCGGAAGTYFRSASACGLSEDHLRDDVAGSVAMTLIHEGVHARIRRAGIRYCRHLRSRIESMCVKEEIRFAQRDSTLADQVIEANDDLRTEWWDDPSAAARRRAQLRSLWSRGWGRP